MVPRWNKPICVIFKRNSKQYNENRKLNRETKTEAETISYLFSADFASSMVKMSNLGILTGSNWQIKGLNCSSQKLNCSNS